MNPKAVLERSNSNSLTSNIFTSHFHYIDWVNFHAYAVMQQNYAYYKGP